MVNWENDGAQKPSQPASQHLNSGCFCRCTMHIVLNTWNTLTESQSFGGIKNADEAKEEKKKKTALFSSFLLSLYISLKVWNCWKNFSCTQKCFWILHLKYSLTFFCAVFTSSHWIDAAAMNSIGRTPFFHFANEWNEECEKFLKI